MPYKRYARKKMVRRKKRIFKRKRFGRRKADGGHLEKVQKLVALTVDAAGTFAQNSISWLATGVSG